VSVSISIKELVGPVSNKASKNHSLISYLYLVLSRIRMMHTLKNDTLVALKLSECELLRHKIKFIPNLWRNAPVEDGKITVEIILSKLPQGQ